MFLASDLFTNELFRLASKGGKKCECLKKLVVLELADSLKGSDLKT